MSENPEETVGIMKLIPGKLASLVIVVGDPKRAEQFATHLEVYLYSSSWNEFINIHP